MATPKNLAKSQKILASVKLDLERNQFYIANYENVLANLNKLESLDSHYEKKKTWVQLRVLLQQQMERYQLAYSNNRLAYSSLLNYQSVLRVHLLPFFGEIKINELKVNDIEKFISKLKLTKKRITGVLSPLRVILNRAKKHGVIDISPLDQVEQAEINLHSIDSEYQIEPFNTEEKEAIINLATGQLRNFIKFAFWTGMRIGEILP